MYDIGSVPPLEVSHVFSAASFEDDRELSTTMTFTLHHTWAQQGLLEAHGIKHSWAPSWARSDSSFTAAGPLPNSGSSNDSSSSTSSHSSNPHGQLDLLARAPAPASEELRRNAAMQKLLLRKVEQVLGPSKAEAPSLQSSIAAAAAAAAVGSCSQHSERQAQQALVPTAGTAELIGNSDVADKGSDGMLHHGSSSWEWTDSKKDIPQQRLKSPVTGSACDGGMYEI